MKLKPFIFEMAISKTPTTLKEFVALLKSKNVQEIKKFLAGKEINAGSNKVVYDIGSNFIFKFSEDFTNEIQKEVKIKKCADSKFLTKIFAYDKKDFHWIITEKVVPIDRKNIQEFVNKVKENLKGSDFLKSKFWYPFMGSDKEEMSVDELDPEFFEDAFVQYLSNAHEYTPLADKMSPWLTGLFSVIKTCKINPKDLWARNWGFRSNGDLVILDYGY